MKATSSQNQSLISCDDLPLPVIIHRKKGGQIVKANRAAKKIFGLTASPITIEKIRPNGLPLRHAKSAGCLNFGAVHHQTVKGKTIRMIVQRKALVWDDKDCWMDFLEPIHDNPIKNKILQSSLDAFISIDENQQVCDWNQSAEKIFGWKKNEVLGHPLVDLIIPDVHKKNHVSGFNQFIKTGKHRILNRLIEISALHKKGHEFPIELTVTSVHEEGKQMFYAFARDISLRKKNEQTQREIQEKLNRAQAIANLGSWEMYGNYNEIHWSDEFYRLHGLEPQSIRPSTKLRLKMTHPHDREKLQKAIDQAIKQGKPYSLEKRIVRPDGETRWILSEGEATMDENGKRKVFGTLLDITERKKTEEALQRVNVGLSETLMFGKMGSAELDLNTNELTVSKELLMLLDIKADTSICTSIHVFLKSYVAPEYLPIINEKIIEGSSGTDISKKVVEVEFEMITAARRRIWIAAKGIFKDQVALGILQDITDRKKINQQISNLTDTIPDGFIYEYWQSSDGSDYKINYISQGCEQLFEVSMEEALKRADSLFSKIHPDDIVPFFNLVEEKRKTPGKFDIDYRIVMDDKRIKWVNGRANVRVLADYSTIIEGIALDVTLKKNLEQNQQQAQILLTQSENNLRAILNASTDFTVFLDTDCNVRLANDQAKATIHWLIDQDLNIGDNFAKMLPYDLRDRFLTSFNVALSGQIVDNEREIELRKKEVSWLQLRFLPVRNHAENIIGVSFNVTDITKRKRAEVALKQSEERLQILYNHTPVMLHSINREGKLIRVSDYWLQKMGYTRDEVLGRPTTDFLTPTSQKLAREVIIPTFFKTGTLKNVEYDFVTKSGEVLNTLLSASGEQNESGEIVKSLAVVTDITEKKKLEKEIEKLAMIASHTSNAVVFTDAAGCITWMNDGFERITEFKRSEAIGKKPGQLLQGNETSLATVKFMSNKLQAGEGFKVEVLNYTKSGKEYWLDLEVMPVRDEEGTLTGFMAIQSDITALKLAISEVLNSQARLQTMMNNAPMVVYMKDLQGRYSFYNHAYQRTHSHRILRSGHTDFDLLDNDSAAFLKEKDEQVIQTKLPVSYEHSINGRQFYTVEFPILNVNDRIYALGGISVDVTERKQAENALLQSEANLKSVVENSDTAFVLLDREFKILSFNQIANQIVARIANRNVAEGDSAFDFVKENRRQAIAQYLNKTLGGNPSEYELPFTIEGQSRWLHIRFFPVFNNKVVTGVIFAMSDITARKTAETEIVQSRERLQLISDNLPSVAIYQYEVQADEWNGQYKYYSVGVEKISGITPDELLKNPEVFEERIHPEDWVEKQRLIKIALENHAVFNQDYRFQHKNGEWKWLRTRSQPSFLENGKVVWNGLVIDITEQKQSEHTLIESEQRFRTMADAAPVLIWMSGKDKLCDYFNRGWLEFTGRTLEQELGNGWAEGVHPDDFDRCVSIYERSFDQRKDFTMEYRLKRYDGQYRWIVDSGTPRFAPNGEFAGYVGSCFDIHDLIETRKKLSDNELRLRTILETEPECVKILNVKGELLEMNKAGLDMVEASSLEQVVGQKIVNLVDEPFRKEFHSLNQSVFNGNSGMLEFSMTGIKGTSRWLETHAVPMRDASGRVISLLGVTRDITLRKKVEKTLRESEERYRKLFDLNPAPTWIFDLESLAFLQVNNAAIAHYGYSREEFLNMTILDIRSVEDREQTLTSVRTFHDDNEGPRTYDWFWRHKKKDGSLINVEIMSIGFLFEGRAARLVTVNDVTNKIQNEKKLLDTLHDKDLLIKEIHHRVKNNLQLISSILYIRMSAMKQSDVRTFLEETRQKIRSIALIHERLLQTESVNQVDIADYLNKLILDLQMTTPSHERKINLNANIESGHMMSLDMAINCGLILNELVTNAVKHAFKDRLSGTIQINFGRKDDQFEFEVWDDGCGMPETIQPGSGGFGMQLLDVFIKQLNAKIAITRVNGTLFRIIF